MTARPTLLERWEAGIAAGGYPVVCENCGYEWPDERFGVEGTRLTLCARCPRRTR